MNWNADPNDPHRYDDLLDRPHPVSALHPPMSRRDRAAQFAPFAALTGLDAAVREAARLTTERRTLAEGAEEELDRALRLLQSREAEHPQVRLRYFQPDESKEGGAVVTVTGPVRHLDTTDRRLILSDGTRLALDDLISIHFL